jgi:hypothetical protein
MILQILTPLVGVMGAFAFIWCMDDLSASRLYCWWHVVHRLVMANG